LYFAHAYLFSLFSPFSSAWVTRQKRIFMSFMFCQIFTFKNYQERASPEKNVSEKRKRKREREGKITQIETFIHRCEGRHKKSHASFNADRHKYHILVIRLLKLCIQNTLSFMYSVLGLVFSIEKLSSFILLYQKNEKHVVKNLPAYVSSVCRRSFICRFRVSK
jgi:hypothetical protein